MPSFTRKAIKESFMELLNEKPLNQITVKSIVEKCGVNRNSFYYHFDDIPSLISEIITENADKIIDEYAGGDSLEDCLNAMVKFALENKRAVLHVYRSASRDMVEQYLMRICHHTVSEYAYRAFGNVSVSEEDKDIMIRFYKCECFGQVIEWLNSGMNYDIQRQFSRLCELRRGMTGQMIERSLAKSAQ